VSDPFRSTPLHVPAHAENAWIDDRLSNPSGFDTSLPSFEASAHGARIGDDLPGYALEGICDAHLQHSHGVDVLEAYSAASASTVPRFIVENGVVTSDELTAGGLHVWYTECSVVFESLQGRF